MSKCTDKRKAYGEGWDTWNVDLLLSSLTDDFTFDDPAMPEPVTKANMAEYMAGWKDRVKQLGGTNYEGSAVTRTTDGGVQYERITYYPSTPDFSDKG